MNTMKQVWKVWMGWGWKKSLVAMAALAACGGLAYLNAPVGAVFYCIVVWLLAQQAYREGKGKKTVALVTAAALLLMPINGTRAEGTNAPPPLAGTGGSGPRVSQDCNVGVGIGVVVVGSYVIYLLWKFCHNSKTFNPPPAPTPPATPPPPFPGTTNTPPPNPPRTNSAPAGMWTPNFGGTGQLYNTMADTNGLVLYDLTDSGEMDTFTDTPSPILFYGTSPIPSLLSSQDLVHWNTYSIEAWFSAAGEIVVIHDGDGLPIVTNYQAGGSNTIPVGLWVDGTQQKFMRVTNQ